MDLRRSTDGVHGSVLGKILSLCGGSAGAKLRVFELNPDMISLAREILVQTPPQFTEGCSCMFATGATIYRTVTVVGRIRPTQSIMQRARRLRDVDLSRAILTSDATRKGPGHHSFIRPSEDRRVAYRLSRWKTRPATGPIADAGRSVLTGGIYGGRTDSGRCDDGRTTAQLGSGRDGPRYGDNLNPQGPRLEPETFCRLLQDESNLTIRCKNLPF